MIHCPKIASGFVAVASLGCISCGTMKSMTSATVEGLGKGFDRVAGIATSPFEPRVPVVEAREESLRELPLGHEQALAYQKTQKQHRNFWIFGPPVDFQEPELPDEGGLVDGGLLPKLE